MTFALTDKQLEAQDILASDATHVMLFGGSRCVSGDTILDGQTLPIARLAEIGAAVEVMTTRGPMMAGAPFRKGECAMIAVTMVDGCSVTVTPDHRFWSGRDWVRADSVGPGSFVAVLSSERGLRGSSSERGPSRLRANAQRWTGIRGGWLARCSDDLRRYGQQLRQAATLAPSGHASQSYVLARSQPNQRQPSHACPAPVSDSHVPRPLARAARDSRSDQSLSHPPTADGSRPTYPAALWSSHGNGRISALSPPQRLAARLSVWLSNLARSALEATDNVAFQFCRFARLSWDKPRAGGYALRKVCTVTETAVQNYYTLHVPVAEQYFANGILHHNSGKTFLLVRSIVLRALKAPKSRHAIFRYRYNAVKSSVVQDTFPKVMDVCFPEIRYDLNKSDSFATMPNGSEIWFAGLDEKERAEKVLGMEFVTVALNECSQIPKSSRDLVLTRLAQQVAQDLPGKPLLKPRMWYDENPPSKGHWSYKLFIQKADPETKQPLTHPADYAWFKINPGDNADNISDGYLDTLRDMSARFRQRFLEGEFADDNPNALFTDTIIETWRVMDGVIPQMVRVVVAVDPSGSGDEDNADNDEIGIAVAGLGIDGNAYVLEDCTIKAGPATWGAIATSAYDRHQADCIVGEVNYGGAMVRQTILTARPRTPFKQVTASRGKHVRAEPFSALYEQGKVRHVGLFPKLEDELTGFSTFGYTGEGSPNRADALVWALSELFPGIVAGPKVARPPRPSVAARSWAA